MLYFYNTHIHLVLAFGYFIQVSFGSVKALRTLYTSGFFTGSIVLEEQDANTKDNERMMYFLKNLEI